MPAREFRRQIPAVDALLRRPALAPLWERLGPAGARAVIGEVLAELRRAPSAEKIAGLDAAIATAAVRRLRPALEPVINATGVVLHTNLGRAPLAAAVAARVAEIAANYTNLELDLATGRRARRDRIVDSLLADLTSAPASLVVNNNAAAVLLALQTLAVDLRGEVLVSRGELVEIGESFRIHEIVARGGARLVEVGATNRTRLADYRAAITPATRLILRVHRSNFTMRGYVAQPSLLELAALAHRARLHLVEDLGSGCLGSLPGLPPQPTVAESLRAGADLVTYSGDKLLGGPQAGLVSGRAALVARLRANPLFRALRADRLTYAALEATLALYAHGAGHELPLAQFLSSPGLEARVRAFASQLPAALGAVVQTGISLVGGGSAPGQTLPTWLILLPPEFAARLRQPGRDTAGELTPVVARVERGRCALDLRTVFPEQEPELRRALVAAANYASPSIPTNLPA